MLTPHLATVPAYLLPAALKSQMVSNKREAKRRARDSAGAGGGVKRRRQDPLQGGGAAAAVGRVDEAADAAVERRVWETSEDPATKVLALLALPVQKYKYCGGASRVRDE